MSVYVVEAGVRLDSLPEALGNDDSDDDATFVCVDRVTSRVVGWAPGSALRRSTPDARIIDVPLAPVHVEFDAASSHTVVHAGGVELRINWQTLLDEAHRTDDRDARALVTELTEREHDLRTVGPSPSATVRALLGGLAVTPPSPTPTTIKTCGLCGSKELPPRPPRGCQRPAKCRLA